MKKLKSFKGLIILVAILFISGITATVAFSLGNSNIKITYNNETWESKEDFNNEWYCNKDNITFSINLEDQYNEYIGNGGEENLDEVPFKIVAKYKIGSEYKYFDEDMILVNSSNNGVYTVTIKNNIIDNGNVFICIEMEEDNIWGVEPFSKEFNIIVDKVAPKMNLIEFPENNSIIVAKEFKLSFGVLDSNISEENVQAIVKKNGKIVNYDWKKAVYNNKLYYSLTLKEAGIYEVEIKVEDKAGNKCEISNNNEYIGESISYKFQIKQDEALDIHDIPSDNIGSKEAIDFSGYIYSLNELKLYYLFNEGEPKEIDCEYDSVSGKISFNKKFIDQGTYTVYAEEVSSETSEKKRYDIAKYVIDNEKPSISINNIEDGLENSINNGIYKNNVNLSIKVNDNNLVYTEDGKLSRENNKIVITNELQEETIYEFNDDGTFNTVLTDGEYTITVEVKDFSGNANSESKAIIVDTKSPEIKFEIENKNSSNIYNQNVKFKAIITDRTLNFNEENNVLEIIKIGENENEVVGRVTKINENYSKDNITITGWKQEGNTATIEGEITKDIDGEYSINVISKDSTDRTKEHNELVEIDTEAPIVKFNGEDNLLSKYDKAQTFNIVISDKNLQNVKLVCEKDGSVIKEENIDKDSNEVKYGKVTFDLENLSEGNYKLTVISKDICGNEYDKTFNFVIDEFAPEIIIEGIDLENEDVINHYNNSKNIVFNINDITINKEETSLIIKKDGEELYNITGEEWDKNEGNLTKEITIDIKDEGLYSIDIKAKDGINRDNKKNFSFIIDGTKPEIKIEGVSNNSFITTEHLLENLKMSVFEKNYNYDEYEVEFEVTKNNNKYYLEYIKEETILINEEELEKIFNDDGSYQIKVNAKDKAGNIANTEELNLTIDNTASEILFEGIMDGSLNNDKDNRNLKIVVIESNYINNTVNISVKRNGKEYSLGVDFESTGEKSVLEKTFNEDGYYEVTVETKDAAGNENSKSISFLIDRTNPEISVSGFSGGNKDGDGFIHYDDTQNISIKISDNNLAINNKGEYVLPNLIIKEVSNGERDVTDSILEGSKWSFNITEDIDINDDILLNFDFNKSLEEGKYEIYLSYTDNVRNKSEYEVIKLIIDSTKPVINLSGVSNDSFNNENKTLTISVNETNYKYNSVEILATKDGELYMLGDFNSSSVESLLSHTFSEDGLYIINVASKDFAGNIGENKIITFTIDKTLPNISIEGIENDKYYNVTKTLSATILDNNHNINNINVTKDGKGYNVGEFKVEGNKAFLNYDFSEEGKYLLEINSVDKAGNSYSKLLSFTIDKTAPVITPMINEENKVIKDGEYINKMFTPYFKLDSEDDSIVSIIMNNDKDVTTSVPLTSKEGKYSYVVTAKDKAGNESKISTSFTVDITNPKIEISGIIDGFFNKDIKPTFEITDDNLDEENTSVLLNGNSFKSGTTIKEEGEYILNATGKDLANNVSNRTVIFTLDKTGPTIKFLEAINGQYFNESIIPQLLIEDLSEYTIVSQTLNGEPYELGDEISEDGKYVLSLEVKDKSGNITTVTVEFIIDKTPPKFIYSGAKNGESYHKPVNLTISLENPFDTIKEVLVNGEIVNADLVEENEQKVMKIDFKDKGEYKLELCAVDEAGNETKDNFYFEISEEVFLAKIKNNKNFNISIIIIIALVIVTITSLIIFFKRKKNVNEN